MVSVLAKLMGDANEKAIKNIHPIVQEINGLEAATKALSDSELRKKTEEFRSRLSGEETLDDLLPEAFAAVREMAQRAIGQRH